MELEWGVLRVDRLKGGGRSIRAVFGVGGGELPGVWCFVVVGYDSQGGFWKRKGDGEGSMLLGKVLVGFQGVRCGNGVFSAGVMKLPSQISFERRLCNCALFK